MWCLLSVNSLTIAVEIWPAELKVGRLALAVNRVRNKITPFLQTTEIRSNYKFFFPLAFKQTLKWEFLRCYYN